MRQKIWANSNAAFFQMHSRGIFKGRRRGLFPIFRFWIRNSSSNKKSIRTRQPRRNIIILCDLNCTCICTSVIEIHAREKETKKHIICCYLCEAIWGEFMGHFFSALIRKYSNSYSSPRLRVSSADKWKEATTLWKHNGCVMNYPYNCGQSVNFLGSVILYNMEKALIEQTS